MSPPPYKKVPTMNMAKTKSPSLMVKNGINNFPTPKKSARKCNQVENNSITPHNLVIKLQKDTASGINGQKSLSTYMNKR